MNILPKPPSIEKPSSITWEEYIQEMYDVITDLASLAGAGRTTETVKGNADDIADLTDDIADLGGEGRTTENIMEAYNLINRSMPVCMLRLIDDVTIPDATQTIVNFTDVVSETIINIDEMFVSTDPSKITIPKNGIYLINAFVTWESGLTGARGLMILKNGTLIHQAREDAGVYALNILKINFIESCVEGDYFEFKVYHNQGTDLDIIALGGLTEHDSIPGTQFSVSFLANMPTGV